METCTPIIEIVIEYPLSMDRLLIFTATIAPPNTSVGWPVKLIDRNLRLTHYLENLSLICDQFSEQIKIIVVENSQRIHSIEEKYAELGNAFHNISFIQAPQDNISSKYGIAAGEHSMLRHISSEVDLNRYDQIWKISGRIKILNLKRIVDKSSGDLIAMKHQGTSMKMDSRLFSMRKDLFVDFANQIPNYVSREGSQIRVPYTFRDMESYLGYFALKIECEKLGVVRSFSQIPVYRGVSGSTLKEYGNIQDRSRRRIANSLLPIIKKLMLGYIR